MACGGDYRTAPAHGRRMWGRGRQRTIPAPGSGMLLLVRSGPGQSRGRQCKRRLGLTNGARGEGDHASVGGVLDRLGVEARERGAGASEARGVTGGRIVRRVLPGARIAAGETDPVLPRLSLN